MSSSADQYDMYPSIQDYNHFAKVEETLSYLSLRRITGMEDWKEIIQYLVRQAIETLQVTERDFPFAMRKLFSTSGFLSERELQSRTKEIVQREMKALLYE